LDALSKLCADPKNTVYVVSGDSSENVLQALGHMSSLGLAVSNGACFSPPLENEYESRRWLTFDLGVDWDSVKRVALPVLSKYTARSNGSFVKLTAFSIGWSYYSCDPEWGSLQATHLVLELVNELRSFDVRFVTLKGIVEIVPSKLNKGLIVRKVLHDTTVRQDMDGDGVDFVLCVGDDVSDEKMFTSVYSFAAGLGDSSSGNYGGPPLLDEDGEAEDVETDHMDTTTSTNSLSGMAGAGGGAAANLIPDPMYAFTVAVGKKPTHAISFVNDSYEVANALVMLASGDVQGGPTPSAWQHNTADHHHGNRMFE
jgi:trehalose-phosphatase